MNEGVGLLSSVVVLQCCAAGAVAFGASPAAVFVLPLLLVSLLQGSFVIVLDHALCLFFSWNWKCVPQISFRLRRCPSVTLWRVSAPVAVFQNWMLWLDAAFPFTT